MNTKQCQAFLNNAIYKTVREEISRRIIAGVAGPLERGQRIRLIGPKKLLIKKSFNLGDVRHPE